jgi:serine/threonine-protein kinase
MLPEMPHETRAPATLRKPLDAALAEEIARIELRIAQVWQGISALSIALAIVLGVRARALGIGGAVTAAVCLVWFTILVRLLRRGRASRGVHVATTVFESTVPWICLAMLGFTQGPAYALGSWVPPLLYGGVVVSSTARLRPFEPVILGVVGAAVFLVLYFAWLRPALPPDLVNTPLVSPQVQISRAFSLGVGGALATTVSTALRRAIGRADSTARERELFGKYRLVRHVASGGMGTVFEALYCPEGGFERPVAVKRIHPHLAREPSFIRSFRNEAELSARLVHPNIVQVLDFGSVEGTYFLAMELVDGLSLRTFMKRTWAAKVVLPPHVIAHIGREILAGLSYTHSVARAADGSLLRVIHRDLCPANLLLSKNGEVKISDFGVARALRDADSTHTRTVAGHLGYMAPEQARAEPIDARADIFAVGVILWELLAGRSLFNRGAEGPTLLALISAEVEKPSTLRADLEPGWDHLVLYAAEREASRRFPSATAMAADLAELRDARGAAIEDLRALVREALALPDPPPDEDMEDDPGSEDSISDLPTRVAV